MPQKPGKYGLKIISMCDAKTYFCSGIPYLGTEPEMGKTDLLLLTQYCLKLLEPIYDTNRNMTGNLL